MRSRAFDLECLWLGTRHGPEAEAVSEANILFQSIFSGKWNRFFTLKTLGTPFGMGIGFIQSLVAINKFKPDIILTSGGYVAVPVAFAAKLLNVPVYLHQQDVLVTLSQ